MSDDTDREGETPDQRPVALLLRRAAGSDPLLARFVETVGIRLVVALAAVPALGGSGKPAGLAPIHPLPGAIPLTEPEIRKLRGHHPDQSLAAHTLTGIFAGARIARMLPGDRRPSDDEWRTWLLGYAGHDYNKVFGIRAEAQRLDLGREALRQLGEILGFAEFWPEWLACLDDILFIAQNAEFVSGSNLDLGEYRLAGLTDHRRRDRLRSLASFCDLLVHAETPSDVLLPTRQGRPLHDGLRERLRLIFGAGNEPRLAYHKMADVRGLLTSLIHNAVMQTLEQRGYLPFLFFSNGTVYLAPPVPASAVDFGAIADLAWQDVTRCVAESENFGFTRGPTGFRASSALQELVGTENTLQAAVRASGRIAPRQTRAQTRLYGYLTGRSDNDLKRLYPDEGERQRVIVEAVARLGLPCDHRVDRLAEFLVYLFRELVDAGYAEEETATFLLEWLGLTAEVAPSAARKEKGGTRFGWYFAAAHHLKKNPGLDDVQVEEAMRRLAEAALPRLRREGRKRAAGPSDLGRVFRAYLEEHLEIDGQFVGRPAGVAGFAGELARYSTAKAGNHPLCTLCATRYDAVEEEATEVPFGNQAYSNRRRLDSSRVIRGICPICRIEYILRRALQDRAREDSRPIQVFLYPTYFFTPETERLARYFVGHLRDINVWRLRAHLADHGFRPEAVVEFPDLLFADGGPRTLFSNNHVPAYDEQHRSGLVFFSMTPGGRKSTDTDAWILPTLVALCAPYLLNVKAVASASFVPVFESSADFSETVVLDGAHGFVSRILGKDRFHVDEVPAALARLLNLYDLHVDVLAEPPDDLHWPLINGVVRDVTTDPYHVFTYYDRRKRRPAKGKDGRVRAEPEGVTPRDVARYLRIFHSLRGENEMGLVGDLVQGYARFYRASGYSTYELVKPLSVAIDAVVETPPNSDDEMLELTVAGTIHDLMGRVRDRQANGFDPIATNRNLGDYGHRLELSRQAIDEFARLFIAQAFKVYCAGDRASLREQKNRLRSAAQFFYLAHYSKMAKEAGGES